MKQIHNWNDLEQFGIKCLTGEACTLGARGLCDLTPEGAVLVREFMGLPYDCPLQASWNSGSEFSCFLPWDILPSLAAFILIKSGCLCAVHIARDGIYGFEPTDDLILFNEWLSGQEIQRRYSPINAPSVGLSSTHAMSGRAQ